LKYEIVHKSYAESWEQDDILEKPLTNYFDEFGTIHLLKAFSRPQIGNHEVILKVYSDLVPESAS